jgi:uncharacterized protein YndB with AHSA1/START domain
MARIELEKTLDAPIDDVFELLSDHAGYIRFRGFTRAELVREGEVDRNGVGAVRRLSASGLTFDEEITAFERPTRMDYLIRRVNVPLQHDGGSIRLAAAGDGTHVDWRSTFTMRIPLVGGAVASVFAVAIRRGFVRLLEDVERYAGTGPSTRSV